MTISDGLTPRCTALSLPVRAVGSTYAGYNGAEGTSAYGQGSLDTYFSTGGAYGRANFDEGVGARNGPYLPTSILNHNALIDVNLTMTASVAGYSSGTFQTHLFMSSHVATAYSPMVFVADVGSNIQAGLANLEFLDSDGNAMDVAHTWDRGTLTNTPGVVPEPQTAALVGVGLLGIVFRLRRKRTR